ncbi:hypothetical protein D3C81_291750 [compost metagenome]
MPGMKDLGQRMRLGRQLAKALTKGIDEQDHQRAPKAVVQRPRQTVFEARGGAGVERSGPDPGGDHARARQTKTDRAVGNNESINVFVFLADQQGQKERGAVEANQQQYR